MSSQTAVHVGVFDDPNSYVCGGIRHEKQGKVSRIGEGGKRDREGRRRAARGAKLV